MAENQKYMLSHSYWGSGIWVCPRWVLGLRVSYKPIINVSVEATLTQSSTQGGAIFRLLHVAVGRIPASPESYSYTTVCFPQNEVSEGEQQKSQAFTI